MESAECEHVQGVLVVVFVKVWNELAYIMESESCELPCPIVNLWLEPEQTVGKAHNVSALGNDLSKHIFFLRGFNFIFVYYVLVEKVFNYAVYLNGTADNST